MPEPFKNNFSSELVNALANMLRAQLPNFDHQGFTDAVLQKFDALELKQRSARITQALIDFMPDDLALCKSTIEAILHPEDIEEFAKTLPDEQGLRGWMVMPVADFVSQRWLAEGYSKDQFIEGLQFLKQLTRRFSAEFAIRDFILADQDTALQEIKAWLNDPNEHVRRLASEGSRPRLPWGKQLPRLIDNPGAIEVILESLVDDDSEYVRRSVANNLNDIAKDNPDFVIRFAENHKDSANKQKMQLLKHACRSLFKRGDSRTLALFGFEEFQGNVNITGMSDTVEWGGELHIEVAIKPGTKIVQNVMLDYVVWHQKANGKQSPKVFKWKVIEGFSEQAAYKKKHSFKAVTTRKYYAGNHIVEIQVNGQVVAKQEFELLDKV